jgi:uncharacterized repeat protein (TIGR01451 family)
MPVMLAAPMVVALAGCGGSSQLAVLLTKTDTSKIKPGSTPAFTLTVVNKGPSEATGVTVRVDLPSTMRFASTTSLPSDRVAVRTQPQEPATQSNNPNWGTWVLGAPVTQADGTVRRFQLDITFTVTVSGAPGDYLLVPHAFSDNADGEVIGAPAKVTLTSAPILQIAVNAEQGAVAPGQDLLYKVQVINAGSGSASGVAIMITLPQGLAFTHTETIAGNASRNAPIDPVRGTLLVFYSGFVIPALSDAGPGLVSITFRVHAQDRITGGRYTVTAQLTDGLGTVIIVNDTAPVTVTA